MFPNQYILLEPKPGKVWISKSPDQSITGDCRKTNKSRLLLFSGIVTTPIKPCLTIETSPTWGFGTKAEKTFRSLHTKTSHLMICIGTRHVPWMYDFYNKISITHSPSFIVIAGVGPPGVLMCNLIGNSARLGCRPRGTAISWGEEWVATVCCSHGHRWEVRSNPNESARGRSSPLSITLTIFNHKRCLSRNSSHFTYVNINW